MNERFLRASHTHTRKDSSEAKNFLLSTHICIPYAHFPTCESCKRMCISRRRERRRRLLNYPTRLSAAILHVLLLLLVNAERKTKNYHHHHHESQWFEERRPKREKKRDGTQKEQKPLKERLQSSCRPNDQLKGTLNT